MGHERHGTHHCLSCKYGGSAYELVADLLGMTNQGAVEWMTERCMGQAPIVKNVSVRIKEADFKFRLPLEVVVAPLEEWPTIPQAYLTAKRHIDAEQCAKWGLGYATTGRLAGRIIIPCRDQQGRLMHYTARSFANSPKRYLEPKREEGPMEGAILGEQFWPPLGSRDLIVVVEGGFNALAAERAAKLPVAALFGSNVKVSHLQKLKTFKRGLLLTDPDLAGERAAEKILMALGKRYLALERVMLPKGSDADSTETSELRGHLKAAYRRLPSVH